jgi:hypothetical protein
MINKKCGWILAFIVCSVIVSTAHSQDYGVAEVDDR